MVSCCALSQSGPGLFAYRGISSHFYAHSGAGPKVGSPTYEQAHVGSDLLTLVSEDTLKRKHGDMSMEETKKISAAVIRRLPRYYRYLGELNESGVQRISSKELSAKMKVTASQIRQDLNNFGGFGQQGYGYNVKYLYDEIAKILGIAPPA